MSGLWVVGAVLALFGCGHSSPVTSGDGGVDSSPTDGSPPLVELLGVSPPLARVGSTVTLEGNFSGEGVVHLPGGTSSPITVLGSHRATMVVPPSTTFGSLTSGATMAGVAFHAVPYQLGVQPFEDYEETESTREPNLLAKPLYGHGTVVVNNSIYVIGGQDGNQFLAEVEQATINDDGSLGAFSVLPDVSLVTARSEFATVVIGNYAYVLGGSGGAGLTSVERAPINSDNTLGPFTILPDVMLTQPRVESTAAVVGDYLYMIGGSGSGSIGWDTVERATIAADGTISTFELVSGVVLTSGRACATSVVTGNKIYVFGGTNVQPSADYLSVEAASIDPDGTISTFAVLPDVTLPSGRCGLTSVTLGDGLYAIGGGLDDSTDDAELLRAPIQLDGTIGSFVQTGIYLPEIRIEPTVVAAANSLYVLGGERSAGTSGEVSVARTTIDADGAFATSAPVPAVALATATYDHAMVTSGDNLYVLGGTTGTGDLSSAVESAALTDGLLGSFATSTSVTLATPRAAFATAVIGDYVYVIGGNTAAGEVGTLERAPIAADGTLGQFQAYMDASLVVARAHASAVVIAGLGSTRFLLVIGGIGVSGTILGSVEYAAIQADGSLGAFAIDPDATLQTPRYLASVAVHLVPQDGYHVFVVGGIGANGYLGDVERGSVAFGGSFPANFAGFTQLPNLSLSTPRAGHASVVLGNTLYVLGGVGTTGYLDSVEAATFSDVDPASPFNPFAAVAGITLTAARGNLTCAVIANQLYTVGGRDSTGPLNSIEAAPLD